MKLTPDLIAEISRFNAGIKRAREAYRDRDVPMFDDCLNPRCGAKRTCPDCRRRARWLLVVATSEAECADLLAIIDRPGLRVLRPCGTTAGYMRHRRHGERPCRPCLDAHSARTRAS